MPGTLLHVGATVLCQHGGQAQPVASNPRVKVSGQPIVVQTNTYTITACPLPPSQPPGPCVSAQWIKAALRVKANNVPVLLQDSTAVCTPTGTGLNIVNTQPRVKGQ